MGYQGQEKDKLNGLVEFDLRQYNSLLGRWLSTDPMAQYASPYLGMGNNPVSFIDPTGGEDFNFYGTHSDYGLGGSGKSNVPWYYLSPGAVREMRNRAGISYKAQDEAKIIELAAMGGYIDENGNKITLNQSNGEVGYYEQAEFLGTGESGRSLWRNPANGKLYATKDGTSALGVWTSLDLSSAQINGGGSVYGAAVPIALTAAAADGPLPIGDVIGGVILAGATAYDATQRTFVTYTMRNAAGQTYVGRTSGYGDPYSIMMNRASGHHMKAFGYGNPVLDRAIQGYQGYPAIRGREQQLIDFYGGVGSPGVGNSIRGVSPFNPAYPIYHGASNLYFGPLAPYTGF